MQRIFLVAMVCVGHALASPAAVASAAAPAEESSLPHAGSAAPPAAPFNSLGRKLPILSFVAPEYPAEQKLRNASGTVAISTGVGVDGVAVDPRVTSDPSVFDASTLDAVRQWIFQPPSCMVAGASQYELRFNVAFTAEEGHYYVAVQDSMLFRSGSAGGTPPPVAPKPTRMTYPPFPAEAVRKNIVHGYAFADVSVDGDGKVTGVQVPFSFPLPVFGESAQAVLTDWTYPGDGRKHEYCLAVKYSLDGGTVIEGAPATQR